MRTNTHTENALIILEKLFKHFIPFAFNLIAKSYHHYDPAINHNRHKMSVDYSNGWQKQCHKFLSVSHFGMIHFKASIDVCKQLQNQSEFSAKMENNNPLGVRRETTFGGRQILLCLFVCPLCFGRCLNQICKLYLLNKYIKRNYNCSVLLT